MLEVGGAVHPQVPADPAVPRRLVAPGQRAPNRGLDRPQEDVGAGVIGDLVRVGQAETSFPLAEHLHLGGETQARHRGKPVREHAHPVEVREVRAEASVQVAVAVDQVRRPIRPGRDPGVLQAQGHRVPAGGPAPAQGHRITRGLAVGALGRGEVHVVQEELQVGLDRPPPPPRAPVQHEVLGHVMGRGVAVEVEHLDRKQVADREPGLVAGEENALAEGEDQVRPGQVHPMGGQVALGGVEGVELAQEGVEAEAAGLDGQRDLGIGGGARAHHEPGGAEHAPVPGQAADGDLAVGEGEGEVGGLRAADPPLGIDAVGVVLEVTVSQEHQVGGQGALAEPDFRAPVGPALVRVAEGAEGIESSAGGAAGPALDPASPSDPIFGGSGRRRA